MKTISLNDLGLNKQSLKRKLNKVEPSVKEKLEKLLDQRTTIYDMEDVEFIVKSFYGNVGNYYAEHNKEKGENLKSLLNIKKGTTNLEKVIKILVERSHEELIRFHDFDNELKSISEKYDVDYSEVTTIANKLETNWINKIL